MKIESLHIRHYRSISEIHLLPNPVTGLVGRNNSGKSNILRAIQIFFDPSVRFLDEESFYRHDTSKPIEIDVDFKDLTPWETSQFSGWTRGEKLSLGRRFVWDAAGKVTVSTIAYLDLPEPKWLRLSEVSGRSIDRWWENKDELTINEVLFLDHVGNKKPSVAEWKVAIEKVLRNHGDQVPTEKVSVENPKGYPNVLKGAMPEFIYVPAVRDITDEAKVAKTNPFGQLVNSVIEKIPTERKNSLSEQLAEIEKSLNRGDEDRWKEIASIESRLNELISDVIECDIEVRMEVPRISEIFSATKIYADDGVRTPIESKGHGLQRSMIFTILRAYAELSHIEKAEDHADERTTIFAVEEPELYLHPQFQRTLLSVLREIGSGNDQVFYSTQSSLFVGIERFDDIVVLRMEGEKGAESTKAHQLKVSDFLVDLKVRKGVEGTEKGIREQYAHAFNPMVNEGFFADRIILVEGPSEEYSFPEYARQLGIDFDRENISIIPAIGKGPIDKLLRVFAGFNIPTYVVFDGDKDSDDAGTRRKSLELLDLLGAPIEDISKIETTVTSRFAVFEYKFDESLRQEIKDFDDLCSAATELLGPHGKPLMHKFIATKLRNEGQETPKTIAAIIRAAVLLDTAVSILQEE